MICWHDVSKYSFEQKITALHENATFVMSIRYYNYKVNLYLLGDDYVEVFVNHKRTSIDKIAPLDRNHSRMKFYSDQIKLELDFW